MFGIGFNWNHPVHHLHCEIKGAKYPLL